MEVVKENKTNPKKITIRKQIVKKNTNEHRIKSNKTNIKRKKKKQKICRVPLFYSDTSEDENQN